MTSQVVLKYLYTQKNEERIIWAQTFLKNEPNAPSFEMGYFFLEC